MKRIIERKQIWTAGAFLCGMLLLTGCGFSVADFGSGARANAPTPIPVERITPTPVETPMPEEMTASEGTAGITTSEDVTLEEVVTEETTQAEVAPTETPTPTPTPTETPTPTPTPEPARATIRMVGDMLLHDPVEEAAVMEDGSRDFSFLFTQTTDLISEADLAIVNQEVILGGEELGITGYPSFNGPVEVTDALAEAGFDVILHATNHALDRGGQGILNTLTAWRERHPDISVAGIHDSATSQDTVLIREVNGIRIAVLNYTYGTNDIPLPDGMPFAVDYLNEERIRRDLQIAEEEADFTIVCPHWGAEYYLGDTDEQNFWLAIFREGGADLVLGAHPHVVGPVARLDDDPETVSNNRGNGDLLVYYSVGNYANWTSQWGDGIANRMVGGMAEITIEQKEDGETVIADYGIRPLICHVRSGQAGITVYPFEAYSEELAAENEICVQDPQFSYAYCTELCDQVWGELWRKDRL